MNYTPTDLEAFVRQRAPEIARDIRAAAPPGAKEADLVAEVERLLERFARNFDVSLHLERERTLINGRADAVYNRFVVEYEQPGALRKEKSARPNQHAIGQVKQYLEGLAQLDRHRKERLAGAVLDGHYFIFVRFREGHWRVDDPVPVSPHSTETFLRYLLSLATELALTPENLVRDFGENTVVSRMAVSALYNALRTTANPKVHILFQQWQRLFSEICGYEEGSTRLDVAGLARSYGVLPSPTSPPKLGGTEGGRRGAGGEGVSALHLFFAIHTYYATFIKLLAVQIAQYYLMPKMGTGLAQVASTDTQGLRAYLHKMERGGVFTDFGFKNFLEGDFFGWYLDAWDQALESALRRMIGDLASYSLVTLDVDPEETRDLLKQLYQNLMPKKLRHDLGEYYTPDWLAERLLNQLGVDGDPRKRLLDPACGSGTFLVLTIKRIREYADDKMLPLADVLDQVLQNVVGFDLNPLAVISARTNYLLVLGDLLQHRRGEISIPVYLADSIMTPQPGKELTTYAGVEFPTAVGKFAVPRSLVDARYIDPLADLLEESVGLGLTPDQFRARLLHAFPLDAAKDAAEVDVAVALYRQLLDLNRQGVNGIWARIIKNAFAPLFQGRFDYVAGNPPWVNWANLPEDYREETKPLWERYGLFTLTGWEARLGGGKKDISVLMTYASIDNYLKAEGRLGFVITQSVFKTGGAAEGFRRFRIGQDTPLCVLHVDDMSTLKPFENASNRTAVIVVEKGRQTIYPVPYTYWRKRGKGVRTPEDAPLDEITSMYARTSQWVAEPIDDKNIASPWMTGRARSVSAIKRMVGASDYQARSGACTWDNGVYWVELVGRRPDGLVIVANCHDVGRKATESVQGVLEDQLLYPLMRGRDVAKWSATPSLYIIMTQDPEKRRGWDEDWLKVTLPKTYAYLLHFKDQLRNRSGMRKYFDPERDPFYSIYNVGTYTFAPFKVCWAREDRELRAALVGDAALGSLVAQKRVVPDQTVQFVPCDDADEAHYICSLLNSSISNYIALGYTSDITTRIMNAIPIKEFDSTNPTHRQLAALSQQAHVATAVGNTAQVREIEAEIDELAAELWRLTEEELREIQESSEELG